MRTRLISAAAAILLLQTACKRNEWTTFRDDHIGFEMKRQARWTTRWVGEGEKNRLMFILAESKRDLATITVSKTQGNMMLEAALLSDFLKGDAKKEMTTLAGRRASRVEGMLPKMGMVDEKDTYVVTYRLNGDQASYAFECYVTPASQWARYRKACETAAASFRLTAEPTPKPVAEWTGPASLQSAKASYKKKDYARSGPELRALAEKNDPEAQHLLALSYMQGQGVEQNMTEAAIWLERAARSGIPDAQAAFGALHLSPIVGRENFAEAHAWLTKAAQAGSGTAMFSLGNMHAEGKGVPKDLKAAVEWYRKAARKGDTSAYVALGKLYRTGGDALAKDMEEAYFWFHLAVTNGRIDAARLHETTAEPLDAKSIAAAQKRAADWLRRHPAKK